MPSLLGYRDQELETKKKHMSKSCPRAVFAVTSRLCLGSGSTAKSSAKQGERMFLWYHRCLWAVLFEKETKSRLCQGRSMFSYGTVRWELSGAKSFRRVRVKTPSVLCKEPSRGECQVSPWT